MIDTNKLWLSLIICTVIGSLIGLPRFLTYLGRLATETHQELDACSSGSAYDAMLDAQEEEPTQPLPAVQPSWKWQFDEIMQRGLDQWKEVEFEYEN